MPVTYRIDQARGRMETLAVGLITYEDILRHLEEEEGDEALAMEELLDARAATTNLTSDQVHALVRRTDSLVRKGRFGAVAIVTDNNVVFGMARMYQILCEELPVRIGVFRDLDEAEVWLNGEGRRAASAGA